MYKLHFDNFLINEHDDDDDDCIIASCAICWHVVADAAYNNLQCSA